MTSTYPRYENDPIPRFVADLAEHLISNHPIDVQVIAPHDGGLSKYDALGGVRVRRFQYSFNATRQCVAYGYGIADNLRYRSRAKWQLPGFFAAMGWAVWEAVSHCDIIHAHWVEPGFVSMLANVLHRKPVVITVHRLDSTPWTTGLYRWTLGRASRVLFNSQFTLEQATRQNFRCRSQVIYQGYDDRSFGVLSRDGSMRTRLGIPADALVVASVGRMVPFKGMIYLVRAASQILGRRSNVHIVIAGSGPMLEEVRQEAKQLPVAARIHCPGAFDRRSVAQLLSDADIFVIPSIVDDHGRTETLGITALEAMASGLPCIGTRVGGICETIVDNQTGFLVEPTDVDSLAHAIGRVLDDSSLRLNMGQAARELAARRFSWSSLATQVARVYGQVVNPNGDTTEHD